jgi:hypothetical protein
LWYQAVAAYVGRKSVVGRSLQCSKCSSWKSSAHDTSITPFRYIAWRSIKWKARPEARVVPYDSPIRYLGLGHRP